MKKNRLILGLLACVFAVVILFTGCDLSTDSWANITNRTLTSGQLNGTWRGSVNETMVLNGANTDAGITYSNVLLNIRTDTTLTIYSVTTVLDVTVTVTFSGGNIDSIWNAQKAFILKNNPGVPINDEKKSYSATNSITASTSYAMGGGQINQYGSKLRFLDNDGSELIFTKQ